MKKSKMVVAIEHNWGLMGPGDWRTVTWVINYDKSYSITVERNPKLSPDWDPSTDGLPKIEKNTITGLMDEDIFVKLTEKLNTKQWRDPDIQIDACDGVAWQIKYYSADGKETNSSGKLGYIYGEEVLAGIVSSLPKTEEVYDASAYISVTKKNV